MINIKEKGDEPRKSGGGGNQIKRILSRLIINMVSTQNLMRLSTWSQFYKKNCYDIITNNFHKQLKPTSRCLSHAGIVGA